MTAGEYALGLLAIISALSLGELVFGLHTLLDHRTRIVWDWLPLVAAAHVFVMVMFAFWVSWGSWHTVTQPIPFGLFLLPVAQLVCLYLAARTVLPRADDSVDGRIDLKAYYARSSRLIFGALAANALLVLVGIAIRFVLVHQGAMVIPGKWPTVLIGLLVAVALAVFPARRLHALVVPTVMLATLVMVAPQVLL